MLVANISACAGVAVRALVRQVGVGGLVGQLVVGRREAIFLPVAVECLGRVHVLVHFNLIIIKFYQHWREPPQPPFGPQDQDL